MCPAKITTTAITATTTTTATSTPQSKATPTKTDLLKDLMSSLAKGPLYFVDKLIYYIMGPTFSSMFRLAFGASPTPVARSCTFTSAAGVVYIAPFDSEVTNTGSL